jgi:hypothetical protein
MSCQRRTSLDPLLLLPAARPFAGARAATGTRCFAPASANRACATPPASARHRYPSCGCCPHRGMPPPSRHHWPTAPSTWPRPPADACDLDEPSQNLTPNSSGVATSLRTQGGAGIRGIATILGRAPSTVSRELARNTVRHDRRGYEPVVAHARARARADPPHDIEQQAGPSVGSLVGPWAVMDVAAGLPDSPTPRRPLSGGAGRRLEAVGGVQLVGAVSTQTMGWKVWKVRVEPLLVLGSSFGYAVAVVVLLAL